MDLPDQERAATPGEANAVDGSSNPVQPRQLAPVAGASAAITVWLAALGLITTPIMLRTLGASAYAVFALITILAGYLSNFQLGFGNTTLRYLARARAMGDHSGEAKIVGTSLFVFSCAGALAAAVAFLGAPAIATSFANFPAELEDDAIGAIRLAALVLVLTFLFSFALVSLQALGRFRSMLWSRALSGTFLSVFAVAAALSFEDVRAVLAAQAVVSLLTCVVVFAVLAKALTVPLRPSFDPATFRLMAGFAGVVLATGIAYQVMLQGPPTVLAGLAPSAELAFFAVAAIVFQQILLLIRAASTGFMPFASAESASRNRARLAAVFRSNLRLTVAVVAPITGFLMIFSETLLTVWLGADFAANAADPLRFLALAGLMLAASAPSAEVATGVGRPVWALGYAMVAGTVGILISVALVGQSGASGAALGLMIGVAVVSPPFVLLSARRLLGMPPRQTARSVAAPAFAAVSAVGLYFLGSLVLPGFAGAVLTGLLITCPYAVATYRLVLDDAERRTLARGVKRLLSGARAKLARLKRGNPKPSPGIPSG